MYCFSDETREVGGDHRYDNGEEIKEMGKDLQYQDLGD